MKELISIVVPCYNEEEALPFFKKEMVKVMKEMNKVNFEIIFVNDGSRDKTLELLRSFSKEDKRFKYVSFSRNFGKEAAIYAGFKASKGDYVAMMDADLQDPPALLPNMYAAIKEEGFDSAATRRITRDGEPPIRSFFARNFYRIINKISDADIVDGARDYRLMTRRMVNAILDMEEYNRFSKGIFGWIGFKTKWISFKNVERVAGETKWSFWKLFKYSIEGIVNFSNFPLSISYIFSVLLVLFLFIYFMIMLIFYRIQAFELLVIFVGLLFAVLYLLLGIMAEYIGRTYKEVKKRPIYIISETEMDLK